METIEEIEKMLWTTANTLEFIDNWGVSNMALSDKLRELVF